MSTLFDIRDLETRLHSHFLEWSDQPLQNELLYLLDELQELHGQLDRLNVPNVGPDGLEMTLRQRVMHLAASSRVHERSIDFYGHALEASSSSQLQLF